MLSTTAMSLSNAITDIATMLPSDPLKTFVIDADSVTGFGVMKYCIETRTVRAVPEDCYDGNATDVYEAFIADVQKARTFAYNEEAKRIVSNSVLMNVLQATCESWVCRDIATALKLPTDTRPFLLHIEQRISGTGRITKDTLRLFLRSMKLLVDLEKHIVKVPDDGHMMPRGIQALGGKGFKRITLKMYLKMMATNGGQTSLKQLKRSFSQIS